MFCGRDIDDVFVYQTRKMVRVHDARLGLLRLSFLVCAISYIIVYRLMYEQAYMQPYSPLGLANFKLASPTELIDPGNPNSGCDALVTDPPCFSTIPDVTTLDYCKQSGSRLDRNYTKYNCSVLDGYENSQTFQSAILIGSRVTSYLQERECPAVPEAAECRGVVWRNLRENQTTFVAGVEEFTLLVDHSFTLIQAASVPGIDDIRVRKCLLSVRMCGC